MSTDSLHNNTLRVAIAGGGTGGHIIPALAIAEELQRTLIDQSVFAKVSFLFFGSDYGMETKMIPEAGFELVTLPIRGLSRSISLSGFKRNLMLPGRLAVSINRANKSLRSFNPHILVGTGGYASAIPVRQALRNQIPVVLQEQNSYPGMVTRLFASKAKQIFLTYEDAKQYLKGANTLLTGNPIREFSTRVNKQQVADFFGLSPELPTLFILGGSQGARALNEHFIHKSALYLDKLDMQILWQTGRTDYEYCQRHVGTNSRITLVPFINDMEKAYSLADLMVCRAGAMTLTEINHFGLPAILIPLPSAAANHQEFNARSQEQVGAARVVLESELNEGAFLPILTEIFTDRDRLIQMSQASKALRKPDAAKEICNSILRIVNSCV
ncbi:MAG: undecaprenyldiphospho-muramoylpentapeptide beta-N-acetylglucosaminyltransferase [Candidatus Marinimicrobia bacterium]|nr:undecaprenyldiphospho-muramoylpentapeptide beta-N-acetylglucosaminyltransferase [Candidatus Neomarinimicrobiota bacterium]